MLDMLLYFSLFILIILASVIAIRAIKVLWQRTRYAAYWTGQNKSTPKNDAIKLVVIGDSIMQGIGASRPEDGLVGLTMRYIEQKTGRPVHVTNLSKSGATVGEVVTEQIPQADLAGADIIIVAASANDATKRTPLAEYKRNIKALTEALPADKTIVADVPGVKRRDMYQPILQDAAKRSDIRRADLVKAFARLPHMRGLTAGDFFHPNNKGYETWFSAFQPELDSLLPQLKSETL